MKQRYLILAFFCLFSLSAKAQNMEVDTTDNKVNDSLKNIYWLADSSFKAFKTETFQPFKSFFPTFKVYQKYVDTAKVGEQTPYTQYIMYQSLYNSLRNQHRKLMKNAKKMGVRLSKLEYEKPICEIDSFQGHVYSYIKLIGRKGEKRKVQLQYTALRIDMHWYMLDEMKIANYTEEKKKYSDK